MEFGKIINREIVISPSDNMGYVVTVGCGRFIYTDKKDLVADLEAYLNDPQRYENGYNKQNTPEVCRPDHQAQPLGGSGANITRNLDAKRSNHEPTPNITG